MNHGYEPQSKLWKKIPQQAAGYYTFRCETVSQPSFVIARSPLDDVAIPILSRLMRLPRCRNWIFTIKKTGKVLSFFSFLLSGAALSIFHFLKSSPLRHQMPADLSCIYRQPYLWLFLFQRHGGRWATAPFSPMRRS